MPVSRGPFHVTLRADPALNIAKSCRRMGERLGVRYGTRHPARGGDPDGPRLITIADPCGVREDLFGDPDLSQMEPSG